MCFSEILFLPKASPKHTSSGIRGGGDSSFVGAHVKHLARSRQVSTRHKHTIFVGAYLLQEERIKHPLLTCEGSSHNFASDSQMGKMEIRVKTLDWNKLF